MLLSYVSRRLAAVAGLTLIDMVKGLEKGVYLENVRLLEKSGGKSGHYKGA